MRGDKTELHRTCVFTEYRATVYYLQGQLKEAGFNTHIFHGGLSLDDKAQSLARFKLEGGVLLATMGMIKGIEFPPIDRLVFYDLPANPRVLAQISARVQRFGRSEPLKIDVLYDLDMPGAQNIAKLRKVLADEVANG